MLEGEEVEEQLISMQAVWATMCDHSSMKPAHNHGIQTLERQPPALVKFTAKNKYQLGTSLLFIRQPPQQTPRPPPSPGQCAAGPAGTAVSQAPDMEQTEPTCDYVPLQRRRLLMRRLRTSTGTKCSCSCLRQRI